jgi:hypothetical protein
MAQNKHSNSKSGGGGGKVGEQQRRIKSKQDQKPTLNPVAPCLASGTHSVITQAPMGLGSPVLTALLFEAHMASGAGSPDCLAFSSVDILCSWNLQHSGVSTVA